MFHANRSGEHNALPITRSHRCARIAPRDPPSKHHGIDSPSSNLSNISSLLWHAYAALPSPSSAVNWAGFYIRDDKFPALASPVSSPPLPGVTGLGGVTISTTYASPEDQILLLGPFHGKPACQQIRFGKGVCGTAAASQKTVIVPDVLQFPGHIACDADSRSEIVVPIVIRGEVSAYRAFRVPVGKERPTLTRQLTDRRHH
jgi:putative methionine-R-sulfoxide reductase with GAF domain